MRLANASDECAVNDIVLMAVSLTRIAAVLGMPIRQPLAGSLHLRVFCFTSALDGSLHVLQSSPVESMSPPLGLMVEAPGIAPGSRELVERFNDYESKYILEGFHCQAA